MRFFLEHSRKRRDGAGGLVERNALHALHRKEYCWQPNPLAIRIEHLTDKIVEGIQVNAAEGDSSGIELNQLTPKLFFGRVKSDDHDGVRVQIRFSDILCSLQC